MDGMFFVFCVIFYILVGFAGSLVVTQIGFPIRLLSGLYGFFLLDDESSPVAHQNGASAPSRQKLKSKKANDDWDPAAAKVVRQRLLEVHVASRRFAKEFDEAMLMALMGILICLGRQVLQLCAPSTVSKDDFEKTNFLPVLIAAFVLSRLIWSLSSVQYDRATTQRHELQLGLVVGFLGFLLATVFLFAGPSSFLRPDFNIEPAVARSLHATVQRSMALQKMIHAKASASADESEKKGPLTSDLESIGEDGTIVLAEVPMDGVPYVKDTEKGQRSPSDDLLTNSSPDQADQTSPAGTKLSPAVESVAIGTAKLALSVFGGTISALFLPSSVRVARCHYQISTTFPWDVGVISHSPLSRTFSALSLALPAVVHLLWIRPTAHVFLRLDAVHQGFAQGVEPETTESEQTRPHWGAHRDSDSASDSKPFLSSGDSEVCSEPQASHWYTSGLPPLVSLSKATLEGVRQAVLLLSCILPLLVVRDIMQAHLNTAAVHWYEKLHGAPLALTGGLPNIQLRMQTVYYFYCKVAMQALLPPLITLMLLLLSWCCHVNDSDPSRSRSASSVLIGTLAMFMAWWCTTIWAVQTLLVVLLMRWGQLT